MALDNADLATHVLRMFLAKWQTQYDLTEKMTPVNTRALLLILEKIKNNTEVEAQPPSGIKPKGAEGKYRMESIDSRIPKQSKQVGFSDKQCALCKTTLMTVVSTLPTLLLSKGMGAQEMHEGADILIKPFKSERTRRGKFRSDNSQRS